MELCAVLGRSADSGSGFVGRIVELGHRLPRIWARVRSGQVTAWRALAIADRTRHLPAEAAAFVDRHLEAIAGTCTWAQVDRLVDESLVRFDPAAAEANRRQAAESRRFDVHTDQVSSDGVVHVDGALDLADALDLEDAIREGAQGLADLGCEEPLNVRRSMALGDLARQDQPLDYEKDGANRAEAVPPQRSRRGRRRRKLVLHVHLTDAALAGASGHEVGRCGTTQSPVTVGQIRDWCARPDASVTVRPVIDLTGHESIDAYEIPDRHRVQVQLRDPTCAFPHCTRRAEGCDLDHATPHNKGGPTCPCNLVPLCRGHHRAKTAGAWTYVVLSPGEYLWTSPSGHQWFVNGLGTRPVDRPTPCTRSAGDP